MVHNLCAAMLVAAHAKHSGGLTYDEVHLWVPVAHLRDDDHQQVYAFAVHQA